MKIEINTRIPLESGKVYYACEADNEFIYAPCPICEGRGKVTIKKQSFTCPECGGKNSENYELTGVKTKWKIAKYYLSGLSFDKDGNITNAHFAGINTDGQYLSVGSGLNSLTDMTIFNEKIYDDYGEVLREVKRKNKEENEKMA